MSNPWDRQRDEEGQLEPMLWFDRFDRLFRPNGPSRTLIGAYLAWRDEAGKSVDGRTPKSIPHSWNRQCQRWNWRERAEAWDIEQRRLRVLAEEEERRRRAEEEEVARAEMHKRHVRISTTMQVVGSYPLQVLVKKIQEAQSKGGEALAELGLSSEQARMLVKDGVAMERTARGLPEHLIGVTELTDAELVSRYQGLLERVGGIGSGNGEEGH